MRQYASKKEKFYNFYGVIIGYVLLIILFTSLILSYATDHLPVFRYTALITWFVGFVYALIMTMIK